MDETNPASSGLMPGRLIAILVVIALEGLAFAVLALSTPRASTLYWTFAAGDLVLFVALLARSEAARMVVQGLVVLGVFGSVSALVGGELFAIVGLIVRVAMFRAIGSEPVRRWTASAEQPRHFSDVVALRRKRNADTTSTR
ncbi:MAG TPA: hypothetical protein VG755_15540 [Nannocystaceae bacterium]|nr:hypothetical protein [Nannocystaceae bacterium]